MSFVIISLIFLFCNGNIAALESSKGHEGLERRTKEMMDQINKILADFYNNIKDTQNTRTSNRTSDETKPKISSEQNRVFVESMDYQEQHKQQGENMRLYHDLNARYKDLLRRSQVINKLKEELVNKYDPDTYKKYADEKKQYEELSSSYKKDRQKHEEMKRTLKMLKAN